MMLGARLAMFGGGILPAGYTQVTSLDSNSALWYGDKQTVANRSAALDTGIVPNQYTTIETTFAILSNNSTAEWGLIFGLEYQSNSIFHLRTYGWGGRSNRLYFYSAGKSVATSITPAINEYVSIKCSPLFYEYNGTRYTITGSYTTNTSNKTIYLAANNRSNTNMGGSPIKFKRTKIVKYSDSSMTTISDQADWVPCLNNTTGIYGFYDVKGGRGFRGSVSTKNWILGDA